MLPSTDAVDSLVDVSRSFSPGPVWPNTIASYLLHNMDNINSTDADQVCIVLKITDLNKVRYYT